MKEIYIPHGKDIITEHGCTCKDTYILPNDPDKIKYHQKCTHQNANRPFCFVKGKCGLHTKVKNKEYWYDYCDIKSDDITLDMSRFGKHFIRNNIVGLFVFLIVFVIVIPFTLVYSKLKSYSVYYLIMIPLFAISLSFGTLRNNRGLVQNNIFQELYKFPGSGNWIISFISTNIIKYISLLFLLYLIFSKINNMERIQHVGWLIFGLYSIYFTFIPEKIIVFVQQRLYNYIQNHHKNNWIYKNIRMFIVSIGLIISIVFIYLMKKAVENKINKRLIDSVYIYIKNNLKLMI